MTCMYGYKAFLCIALLIGDDFYNFHKVILVTLKSIHEKWQRGRLNRVADEDSVAIDDLQRNEVFNRDNIRRGWRARTTAWWRASHCGGEVRVLVSDLIHDFKKLHSTTSPRSMVVEAGTLMGCVVAPLTFFLFYEAFDASQNRTASKAPTLIYRNMAILGVEGFSASRPPDSAPLSPCWPTGEDFFLAVREVRLCP
ncbi:hypothetical protein ZWY2020_059697 [Hordeum vulgare]|nr:hypothetical protein ZWY2020_059697 [Hordeum vulgare]